MADVDYFAVIHKYIPPDSLAYRSYLPHVSAVTYRALEVARRLGLSAEQRHFIEEAAMLHDLGVICVDHPELGFYGQEPYVRHMIEGRRILEEEGLPRHAEIAGNHVGLGITVEEIREQGLPLPPEDLLPESLEAQVISWADLFFTKVPGRLWTPRTPEEVREHVQEYGERAVRTFELWRARFGE